MNEERTHNREEYTRAADSKGSFQLSLSDPYESHIWNFYFTFTQVTRLYHQHGTAILKIINLFHSTNQHITAGDLKKDFFPSHHRPTTSIYNPHSQTANTHSVPPLPLYTNPPNPYHACSAPLTTPHPRPPS